jgi:hypothetical protein
MAKQIGISVGNKVGYGVVQNSTRKTSVTKVTTQDETGYVDDTIAVSKKVERNFDFVWNGGEVPDAGESITIGGDTLLVDSMEETEKTGEAKTGSISASNDDGSTITEYVAPTP